MANKWVFGLVFLSLGFAHSAMAQVWQNTQQWSMPMESRFAQFIQTLPMDFFKNPQSPLAGLATDCADAVYALRIYFAWQNSLPVEFQARTELSNGSKAFDQLPAGIQRVRAFIRFVSQKTNTASLPWDTVPVAINRQSLQPGVMYLNTSFAQDPSVTYRAGHVYYLGEVRENGLIIYFSSTVPTMVRTLSKRWTIRHAPRDERSGYRAWKWPQGQTRPNVSTEQFSFAGWRPHQLSDGKLALNWQEQIQRRIRTRLITPAEQFEAMKENVKEAVLERAEVVEAGWARFLSSRYQGRSCFNSADYDSYSTPSRDVKIQEHLILLRMAAKRKLMSQGQNYADNGPELQALLKGTRFAVMPGVSVDFHQLWNTFRTETALVISEPEHSPQVRWGLSPQGPWVCPERKKQYKGHEILLVR